MNRKMVRGIIVLIVLLGIVCVFLLIGQNTDTEPKKVYNEPSDEVIQKVGDDLAAQKAQNAVKPPPAGETFETGHWDGERWHRTVLTPTEPIVTIQTENRGFITVEEYQQYITEWENLPRNKWGLPSASLPKPPGKAGKFRTFEEKEKASDIWWKLMEKEAALSREFNKHMNAIDAIISEDLIEQKEVTNEENE